MEPGKQKLAYSIKIKCPATEADKKRFTKKVQLFSGNKNNNIIFLPCCEEFSEILTLQSHFLSQYNRDALYIGPSMRR